MAVEVGVLRTKTVSAQTNNIDTTYGGRSGVIYNGTGDVMVGGYTVGEGPFTTIESGHHDKVVMSEASAYIKNLAHVVTLLGYEPVVPEIHPDTTVEQMVMFYGPNLSGVPNIDRILSMRAFQFDHPGISGLINGSIFAAYGHALSGQGQALAPAAHPGYFPGRYYPGVGMRGRAEATLLAGLVATVPFHCAGQWAPNRIGMEVITPLPGSAVLGIYTCVHGTISQLHSQAVGTIDLSTPGYKELVIDSVLQAGTYYLAAQSSVDIGIAYGETHMLCAMNGVATPTLDDTAVLNAFYQMAAYSGTLPTTFTSPSYAATQNLLPNIMLRAI